jgi:hypothetical protein
VKNLEAEALHGITVAKLLIDRFDETSGTSKRPLQFKMEDQKQGKCRKHRLLAAVTFPQRSSPRILLIAGSN